MLAAEPPWPFRVSEIARGGAGRGWFRTSVFPAKPHAQRKLRDNCVWSALSFTIDVVGAGPSGIGSIYCVRNQLKWVVGLTNLGEKILLGWLSAAWLIPIGLAWPRRHESPLWAWTRIISAAGLFSVLELWIWRRQTPYLDYAFYVSAVIYVARFFVRRKLPL